MRRRCSWVSRSVTPPPSALSTSVVTPCASMFSARVRPFGRGVGVDVDEARRDVEPGRVDLGCRLLPEGCRRARRARERCRRRRRTRGSPDPVDDGAAADDDVVGGGGCSLGVRQRGGGDDARGQQRSQEYGEAWMSRLPSEDTPRSSRVRRFVTSPPSAGGRCRLPTRIRCCRATFAAYCGWAEEPSSLDLARGAARARHTAVIILFASPVLRTRASRHQQRQAVRQLRRRTVGPPRHRRIARTDGRRAGELLTSRRPLALEPAARGVRQSHGRAR